MNILENYNPNPRQSGFSLLVVAVMLVSLSAFIITLLLPPSATSFDKVDATQKKLAKIRAAISTYYSLNAAYPCPASFTAAAGASTFGVETNTNTSTNCKSTTTCSGSGLACPALPAANTSWIGAVPVRTIGLPDDYEFDGWGNRFTYIVNNQATFTVNNYNSIPSYVNFYVLSHGPDAMGAYNKAGSLAKTCTLSPGASATNSEYENCNFEIPTTGDDTFLSRQWNSGTDFYDDIGMN